MTKTKYNYSMIAVLTMIPLVGIFGTAIYAYNFGIVWQEPVLLLLGCWISGMGITFGYHRLFAHRSFKAHPAVQWVAMIFGSAALQNSILKWCSDHRRHHRKLDTKDDPYSITKGFFHAHIGWVLASTPSQINDVKDLQKNPIVNFQYKYYWVISISMAFILPFLVGLFYGRPIGGLLWGGFLRVAMVHHFTFFINSLCHFIGKRPYELSTTARDSWIVSFFTFGEGYHNFHHKFQWDYRNGVRWFDFDPGKWAIKFLSYFKLTNDIRMVKDYQILQAKLNGLKEKLSGYYPKLPEQIKQNYSENVQIFQQKAQKIFDSWRMLEKEFILLKQSKIKDKFQLSILKQKRKLYRSEYFAILNGLALMLTEVQKGNY